MLDLLQQVDLLKHLTLGKFVLHVTLLDGLDGHLLASQLVDAQRDFPECALANQLLELVKVKRCRRQLICPFNVRLDVLDQVFLLVERAFI